MLVENLNNFRTYFSFLPTIQFLLIRTQEWKYPCSRDDFSVTVLAFFTLHQSLFFHFTVASYLKVFLIHPSIFDIFGPVTCHFCIKIVKKKNFQKKLLNDNYYFQKQLHIGDSPILNENFTTAYEFPVVSILVNTNTW